ncbi:hypothetical protein LINPERPRIM_LOCUS17489 [Linum perenne]
MSGRTTLLQKFSSFADKLYGTALPQLTIFNDGVLRSQIDARCARRKQNRSITSSYIVSLLHRFGLDSVLPFSFMDRCPHPLRASS